MIPIDSPPIKKIQYPSLSPFFRRIANVAANVCWLSSLYLQPNRTCSSLCFSYGILLHESQTHWNWAKPSCTAHRNTLICTFRELFVSALFSRWSQILRSQPCFGMQKFTKNWRLMEQGSASNIKVPGAAVISSSCCEAAGVLVPVKRAVDTPRSFVLQVRIHRQEDPRADIRCIRIYWRV